MIEQIGEILTNDELKKMYNDYGYKSGYDFENWKNVYVSQFCVKVIPGDKL